jgi:hypothetical protein
MPNLKFVSLICHRTDDSSEDDAVFDVGPEDEPYLLAGNKRIWSGRMAVNDFEDLTGLEPVSFKNSIRVELWDRDPGYTGEDDKLGHLSIQAFQAGLGELTHEFRRKKAKYTLTYKVE